MEKLVLGDSIFQRLPGTLATRLNRGAWWEQIKDEFLA